MMDTSGSMKGLRMAIAKHTVSTILDTLGENDFVNIISVNSPSRSRKPVLCLHRNDLYLRPPDASCCEGPYPLKLGLPTQDRLPGVHSF